MRYLLSLIIFVLCFWMMVNHFKRIEATSNDIDELVWLAEQLTDEVVFAEKLIYLSDWQDEELYYKSQFAMVPHVLLTDSSGKLSDNTKYLLSFKLAESNGELLLDSLTKYGQILADFSSANYRMVVFETAQP